MFLKYIDSYATLTVIAKSKMSKQVNLLLFFIGVCTGAHPVFSCIFSDFLHCPSLRVEVVLRKPQKMSFIVLHCPTFLSRKSFIHH